MIRPYRVLAWRHKCLEIAYNLLNNRQRSNIIGPLVRHFLITLLVTVVFVSLIVSGSMGGIKTHIRLPYAEIKTRNRYDTKSSEHHQHPPRNLI